ncbi:MAG: PEP-utilizing enzyme [Candidatus Woesearchaeota archaeon]
MKSIDKSNIKRIAYSGVVGDLFHYGHLQSLKFAKSISDFNVCGVLVDSAVAQHKVAPICRFEERSAVISSLRDVDRVMPQDNIDPTNNLMRLHKDFPYAEIILVHGSDWKYIPGESYLQSIGGKVMQHPYYERLSDFKVAMQMAENKDKLNNIIDFSDVLTGRINIDETSQNKMIISTKANTLKILKPLLKKSYIEELYDFTVSDWKNAPEDVLSNISKLFNGSRIILRSSAVNEDSLDSSLAGCFSSVLDIDPENHKDVSCAISEVLDSYKQKNSESSFNQVLVQRLTTDIVMSGVIFTRSLEKNGPYYVINYDDITGASDSVTKGIEDKCLYLYKYSNKIPDKFIGLIESVKEIEGKIVNLPLDIEFAVTRGGKVVIFQVRPLVVNLNKKVDDLKVAQRIDSLRKDLADAMVRPTHLGGDTTIFADMPDWNPAEIIGDCPNVLDYSLYDYIITDSAWHEARASQGYYDVNPAKLVVLFGNKPYVNVRHSFNSFVPASMPIGLRDKLVSFYLDKLRRNPELQDKVEFEIAYTCYDFDFENRCYELLDSGFDISEIELIRGSLLSLTDRLISEFSRSMVCDILSLQDMGIARSRITGLIENKEITVTELIGYARSLLDGCREKGTVQFSRFARLAFISKILLRSMVNKGILDQMGHDYILSSIRTVATELSEDFIKLNSSQSGRDEFLRKYYHLRPGTYDITSPRYIDNPNLFSDITVNDAVIEGSSSDAEYTLDYDAINSAFIDAGFSFDSPKFLEFVRRSIELREWSKFEFTKNLSDAIELIARAGDMMGFSRNEIALMDIKDILNTDQSLDVMAIANLWRNKIEAQSNIKKIDNLLILPPLIISEEDFNVVKFYEAKPNFITSKEISGEVVVIKESMEEMPEISGKIVLIKNGDPGYDWIFTKNPLGLVTKYGGVASHMAIRCAEFGIPAAIGCGEWIFNRILNSKKIKLNCNSQRVELLR